MQLGLRCGYSALPLQETCLIRHEFQDESPREAEGQTNGGEALLRLRGRASELGTNPRTSILFRLGLMHHESATTKYGRLVSRRRT